MKGLFFTFLHQKTKRIALFSVPLLPDRRDVRLLRVLVRSDAAARPQGAQTDEVNHYAIPSSPASLEPRSPVVLWTRAQTASTCEADIAERRSIFAASRY